MQPTMRPLAQAIQAQGRGKDTMLVHMTPREVGGLQALALAHGGSLTINPETGLPEAGFLESVLPTLLGVGLSFIPGVGPLMAAGIVGGGTALATGDIGKGLMAGLGAYGGAGLGASLGAAGAAGLRQSRRPDALVGDDGSGPACGRGRCAVGSARCALALQRWARHPLVLPVGRAAGRLQRARGSARGRPGLRRDLRGARMPRA